MDPLEALRSGIAKSRKLERLDGNIIIGKYAFPDKTYTCMKKLGAHEKHESDKESSYYTLDCIFFCWTVFSKNPDTDIGTYIELCTSNNIGVVSFNQVPSLMNYLNKKEESCVYFDMKASFRHVKPLFAGSLNKTPDGDAELSLGIGTYKRMRAIIGNEKIYKTRSKMINLEGTSSFKEAIDLLRRDEKRATTQDEDWKGRMDVSDININLEEGFLTQPTEAVVREAIIIVPPSAGANVITMFNIEKFVNDGVYESSEELKKKSPVKPQEVIINHTIHNRKMRFRFIDNPSRLSKEDWKRVVCVMTGSQAWQFRGWRIPNPTDLFSRYLGIFIWFSDSPVPAIVNGWNVKVVTIHRDVRNMDSVASIQFWDMVEKEIKTRKVDLLK